MLQTISRGLLELLFLLFTAVATHFFMSFAQTLMHYILGHHPIGGKFFRNHLTYHHAYYCGDHLVSQTYLGDEGNNTPFFFIPVLAVGACTFFLLPIDLFIAQVIACSASFYVHVFLDKEYHVEGSRLRRFAWFRRKQELTLRSSPIPELQLRGDRFLLGSDSWNLQRLGPGDRERLEAVIAMEAVWRPKGVWVEFVKRRGERT